MEGLLEILNQFKDTGYTSKMMEESVRNYLDDHTTPFDEFTVDDLVCALQEEQSCWE